MEDDEQVQRIFREFTVDSSTELKLKHLPFVRAALVPISTKWYEIGLFLKVEKNKLDEIKYRRKMDSDKCLTAMLAAWLSGPSRTTWETVVKVMAYRVAGDNPNEAMKVAELYQAGASHDSGSIPDFENVDDAPIGEDQLGSVLDAMSDVSKWQEIGLLLGISYMKLQMVELDDYNITIPHKMKAMVELWLGRKYDIETFGKPSWKTLVGVIAARAGGQYPRLASDIAAKHPRADSISATRAGQIGTAQVTKVGTSSTSGQNGATQVAKVGGEYDRVDNKRVEIVEFLAANVSPEGLADRLLVQKLIGEDIRDQVKVPVKTKPEKIRCMIDAVIARIKLNPANYVKFIDVLKQHGSLEDLIHAIET